MEERMAELERRLAGVERHRCLVQCGSRIVFAAVLAATLGGLLQFSEQPGEALMAHPDRRQAQAGLLGQSTLRTPRPLRRRLGGAGFWRQWRAMGAGRGRKPRRSGALGLGSGKERAPGCR
jgi:hypothetical protein